MAAFLAAFLLSTQPSAAQQCNERADVLELLAQKYKEAPIAVGVTNTGGLVEVLADPDGQTWTIIVTTPKGISCFIAAGEGWRSIKPEPDGPTA